MNGYEWRRTLRNAVYRADGAEVVALLERDLTSHDALQLIGDGLLAALLQHVDGATGAAVNCAAALRERGWRGDDDLALHLEAALGTTPIPTLRTLAVDLEELASILEGDAVHGGGRIDLHTGEVWPQAAIDYAQETGDEDADESDDEEQWLWVHCEGSHAAYHDMELFIGSVDDPGRAERLAYAIQGRGAFRRFRDVLDRWPDELDRWSTFADERQRGRARAWLTEAGYRIAPSPTPTPRKQPGR